MFNALWALNLVQTTPEQSVMHCRGKRSCRGNKGQPEDNCPEMLKNVALDLIEKINKLVRNKIAYFIIELMCSSTSIEKLLCQCVQ